MVVIRACAPLVHFGLGMLKAVTGTVGFVGTDLFISAPVRMIDFEDP